MIRLWDLARSRTRWFRGGERRIDVVAFSPDGRTLVSAGADKVARLWRVSDGVPLHELIGHRGPIVAASFSPDGLRLVTASLDKTARIWNAETGAAEHVLRGHRGRTHVGIVQPEQPPGRDHELGPLFACLGIRQAVKRLCAAAAGRGRERRLVQRRQPLARLRSPDRGSVGDEQRREPLSAQAAREPLLTAVAFSPSGWRIATGGLDGSVRTYDCRLCGRARLLAELAKKRLERLTR